jgi:hypothetical protein
MGEPTFGGAQVTHAFYRAFPKMNGPTASGKRGFITLASGSKAGVPTGNLGVPTHFSLRRPSLLQGQEIQR